MLTFVAKPLQPLLEGVLERRARRMANLIEPELTAGQRVLDVGCGDLRIGRNVTAGMNVEWTGLDTVDYRGPQAQASTSDRVRFRTYDGDALPFPPASFDTVLLSFVLHHCVDPAKVLDECVRVSSQRLIIFEAVPRNRLEFWIAMPYDWFVNRVRSPDIPMPFNFMSQKQLVAEFDSRHLKLVRAIPVRTHPLALVQQVMFVVERQAHRE